jgi:hypothetical protein
MSPTDRSLALGFILSTIGAALTLATWHQLTRPPQKNLDHERRDPRMTPRAHTAICCSVAAKKGSDD